MNIFRRISNVVRGELSRDKDKDGDKDKDKNKNKNKNNGWGSEKSTPFTSSPIPHLPRSYGAKFRSKKKSTAYHDHSHYPARDHYAQCAEIWDKNRNRWMIFNPKDAPSKPVIQHEDHIYFCVTARYKDYWSEPYHVLTHFSEPLLAFVNTICGSYGSWQSGDAQANVVEMGQAFRTLKEIKAKTEAIKDARNKASQKSAQDKVDLARSLGNMAVDIQTPEAELNQYLEDLEKQLKTFITYLDKRFKLIAERLASAVRYGYMEFDLLPYYFEPGQLVWFNSISQQPLAMKISQVNVHDDSHVAVDFSKRLHQVEVEGYGYTWDGKGFSTNWLRSSCFRFNGNQELSKLPIQLLTPEKREELTARGRRYKAEAGIRYRIYKGDRIVIDRIGFLDAQSYESNRNKVKNVKNRRRDSWGDPPNWQDNPKPEPPNANPGPAWGRSFAPSSSFESLLSLPPVAGGTDIDDEMLCFLPTDLYGYNLSRKEWQSFDLDSVKPVQFDGKAWDHLVLDADVKTLIKGLVEVSTKAMTASGALVNDVIARKGGGLTSALYGPPGTGKTLTAEAVAELLRRPLLTVGSSDLPRDPSGMEDTLQYVLKLATAWDAVVLIDEADVFLEQRSLHEIERNALVSVALRVLEYHRGVVFLTTNRIKVFDEAFLSRFSIAIKYPELNKAGRYLIWSRFLELAGYKILSSPFVTDDDLNEKIIPRQSIEELAAKDFNGRTIKNLVRTAQALALSANSHLKMEHIHVVVRAQEKFLADFAVERALSPS